MAREGESYKAIGDAINRTSSAVKLYVHRKYKEEADKLWANEIKAVGSCEVSGLTENLNAHHLLSKGAFPQFRFDLSNGVCLTADYHTFNKDICPHGTLPAMERFLEWLKTERPGQFQWYEENKHDKRPPDLTYKEAYEALI